MKAVLSIFCLLFAFSTEAALYYIDYNAANDSANGTSVSTPFKRHPYMVGFAGSYSHTAGDRFIFKGGVTWPWSVFQMSCLDGGSGTSVMDYYGTNASWYSGTSFSNPVFDGEHTVITGFGAQTALVLCDGVSYIIFDSITFTNYTGPFNERDLLSSRNYGSGCLVSSQVSGYITATNCWFGRWNLSQTPDGLTANQDGGGGFNYIGSGGIGGLVASRCVFDNTGETMHTGDALWSIGLVEYCRITNCSSGYRNGSVTFRYNDVGPLLQPTDPTFHANACQAQYGSIIDGNKFHDLPSQCSVIAVGMFYGGFTNEVRNNVIWNVSQIPIAILADGTTTGARVQNNTVYNVNGGQVEVSNSGNGSGSLGLLDVVNNLFINDSGTPINAGGYVTVTTNKNQQITLANAATYGATSANSFRPTLITSPTIRAGTNLSDFFTVDLNGIARGSSWDVGAYQFQFGKILISGGVTISGKVSLP